jgi:hypothetical protein
MQSALKLPGTLLLKLRYDEALSDFAFDINLRRYTKSPALHNPCLGAAGVDACYVPLLAGAYTRPLFSSS